MELLRELDQLFRAHEPETLMALFGAATSLLLFYLIGALLRYLFGWQTRQASRDTSQDQATAALLEALVEALVTEAGHLRTTLDSILEESLRRSEQHSRLLANLAAQAEETPGKTAALLRPEFDHLRRELRQAEARLSSKMTLPAGDVEAGEAAEDTEPERRP
jgi:flagellar biosynthesis/type III secretory pathway M-ring protein FliF/YscJ